jgi:GGDEF domain-containing protein
MKQLKIRAITLTIWMACLYFLFHFLDQLTVGSFTYLYLLFVIVLTLAVPYSVRIHQIWFYGVPIVIFWGIKAVDGIAINNILLTTTIIESMAILITISISIWIRSAVHEFDGAVADLTFGKRNFIMEDAAQSQNSLYREARRARNHQRPLSIMLIGVDRKSIQSSTDQIIREAQQRLVTQMAMANISRILREKLEDCDTVAQTDDHFLVILPETRPEDLPGMIERLQAQITRQIGVEINIGTASMPQDSFTMEGLLEKATLEMQSRSENAFYIEPEREFLKNKTS